MHTLTCLIVMHFGSTMAVSPSWTRDYELGLTRAEAAKKPLAVFIGSGKDGWNAVCEEGALSPEARRLLADHYVCVYIDGSRASEQSMLRSFEAGQLPLMVLSSHNRAYQAYRHSGKLANASLSQVLQHHAKHDVVEAAFTQSSPEPVYQSAPCRT